MSNPYQRQVESAGRLIASKGQPDMVLYRVKMDPAFDPLHPDLSVPVVDIQCAAAGVVLPASNGTIEAFDNRILSDPALRRRFRFVILAGLGLTFVPQPEDLLKTVEGLYRLLGSTPIDPAGQGPIIYNCGCTLETQLTIP